MALYPGQKVVCVAGPDFDCLGRDIKVRKGQIYTVAATFEYFGEQAIYLQEVYYANGWMAKGFRPVTESKTDISTFTRLLKTKELVHD